MTHELRSQEPTQVGRRATQPRLPALLCALATVLSLTLAACDGIALPPDRTPTPALPPGCIAYGDAAPVPPPTVVATTLPVAAAGVVYVGYTLRDATRPPALGHYDQYAIAALRASDGATLWRVPAASGLVPLVVADGVLIVLGSQGSGLVGLRASDGATLWRVSLGTRAVTPSGGVLYVIDNAVYAMRIADGRVLWEANLYQTPIGRSPIIAPPVVEGTSVYVEGGNGSVVALRTNTGAVRWITRSPDVSGLPLAAAAGQLYVLGGVAGEGPGVLRLNPIDGASEGYALYLPTDTEVWYEALQAGVFSAFLDPLPPSGDTPTAALPTISAYRLSASGGQLLWRVPVQHSVLDLARFARDAQTLYFVAAPQGVISAFRLADGALLWQQRSLASMSTGIVVDSGYLFETTPGALDPCRPPPVGQAFTIRALTSADGHVAWIRALDAKL